MPIAHFVVTGAAMTTTARALLVEDEPGKAYRLLADGLIGPSATEAALNVLQGTHDLAGDSTNGLELVEASEDDALSEFRQDVNYTYAGRYRVGRVWRRPVAWITNFGKPDGDWATKQLDAAIGTGISNEGASQIRRWWKLRAAYYCAADEEPILLDLPGEGSVYVVFESCGEPPHWMHPNTTAKEALHNAMGAGRSLAKRSPPPADPEPKWPRETEEELHLRDAEDDRREVARQERLRQIGERVRHQAGDDTFVLQLKDGRKLTIPRAPFIRWALHRTDEKDQAPPWDNVAPSGVKLQMDSPDHTDWVLGSGITLDEAYSDAVNEPAWDAASRFQEEARNAKHPYPGIFAAIEHLNNLIHTAATVVDAGIRTGVVGVDIAVFPDSDGSRVDELGSNVGVVVQKGGALAHFAIVTKGRGITVMRHPKACALFTRGTRVKLDPKTGRVVILED